jgi:hypothetical protein
MDAYIFNADIYCADCAGDMIAECKARGIADDGDSNTYPQGPYPNGGGEADCPQHCGSCYAFLQNPLTSDGVAYVKEAAAEKPRISGSTMRPASASMRLPARGPRVEAPRRDQMDKLTIVIEKIDADYFSYVAEGGPGFGELRGCQSAEAIAKMIVVDLRSWIATTR